MTRYANKTSVSPEQTRIDIERELARYGADKFMVGWEEDRAMIAFRVQARHVKFVVSLPDPNDEQFSRTPARRQRRSPKAQRDAYDQAECFDDAFMAQIVLPDGSTVAENVRPAIANAYETGKMPPLLPHMGGDQ